MPTNNMQGPSAMNYPFRDLWSITNRHKGLLTCTSISPSGMWLVSGSQGGSVLFVDHKAGLLAGILDLESQFYITAAVWRSDTIVVIGCSNGVVYHLDFEYKSKRPVGMHTLIKSLKSPIRCIAFDTFRDMLAVACGGEVWIYVRSLDSGAETWDCVDHILAPCVGPSGLVTALCFFGFALGCRHLFIGHAKSGWTIWVSPRSYHRTPFVDNGLVCTIASATISLSEKFMAIVTLDHSLVTYELKESGPMVDTHAKMSSTEISAYRPILPIAATASDLILKGTAVGDIELLDLKTHSTASLQHAHNHIIRTLSAYGDKVVVGSSGLMDDSTTSCLRCYSFSSATEPRDWRRIDDLQGPIFEVTLSSILPLSERIALCNPLGVLHIAHRIKVRFMQRRALGSIIVLVGALGLALALDPPSQTTSALGTDLQHSYNPRPYASGSSQAPALSALAYWGARTLTRRLSMWFIWTSQFCVWFAKLAAWGGLIITKCLVVGLVSAWQLMWTIPQVAKQSLLSIPDVLAEFICDVLKANGSFNEICP